jgi:hypothetical protein
MAGACMVLARMALAMLVAMLVASAAVLAVVFGALVYCHVGLCWYVVATFATFGGLAAMVGLLAWAAKQVLDKFLDAQSLENQVVFLSAVAAARRRFMSLRP